MTHTPEELDVKRFTHDCQPSKLRPLGESPDGGWVRYGDYAALRLSLEAARAKLPCGHHKSLDDSYGGCVLCQFKRGYEEYEAELEAARGELAEWKHLDDLRCQELFGLREDHGNALIERDALRSSLARLTEANERMRDAIKNCTGELGCEAYALLEQNEGA